MSGSNIPEEVKLLTVEQIRAVDRIAIESFGINSLVLMENAGRGASDLVRAQIQKSDSVQILCGTGNNGGDGLVIARHLYAEGYNVKIGIIGNRSKMSPDCKTNYEILTKTKLEIRTIPLDPDPQSNSHLEWLDSQITSSNVIIDALLGTGATGSPRGAMATAIRAANQANAFRVAIDIPSGLDANTGHSNDPTFQAHETITFVAPKVGFRLAKELSKTASSPDPLGTIHTLPIGVPPEVLALAISLS
jgi:NAD(P)H-hydrate epimerase